MSSEYKLPILLYHRVVSDSLFIGRQRIYIREKRFRSQMQWLKSKGYETITFNDLKQYENDADLSGKIILTFDDGYIDNYTILFPILKEYGFKAVIFLATRCKTNDWAVKEGKQVVDLMTTTQLLEMDAYGIEFGGHTQHHTDLKLSSVSVQREEIDGCFKDLEMLFGKKPVSFAYPFGAYNDDTLRLMKESGFVFGVTTIFGPTLWLEDLMRVRRIEVNANTKMISFRRKVSGRYFQTNWFNFLFNNK